MATWTEFSSDQPELAERARTILSATTNAVLGTIRADGSPRLSGIDPFFVDGELWLGSMPGARKGADIARDPRIALHSVPWESRPPPTDGEPAIEADVKISARAVRVTDPARQAEVMAAFAADRGFDAEDADGASGGSDDAASAGPDPSDGGGAGGDEATGDDPDLDEADLFAVDLVSVVLIGVADEQLVIERWSPTDGLLVTRRS